jgi:hypothetical protein
MSNSIHSLKSANAQVQTEQTVQPPKQPQTPSQNLTPQDMVKIGTARQQRRAATTQAAISSDTDHDGDTA